MKILFKSILYFLCLALFLTSLSACGKNKNAEVEITPMPIEEVYSCTFNAIGGSDVMPIGGYNGPYDSSYSVNGFQFPNFIEDKYYKLLSDAGVNLITQASTSYSDEPELIDTSMNLAKKYNMGIFVTDWRIINQISNEELDEQYVMDCVNDYYNYDAFCGVFLVDEPTCMNYYYHPELPLRNLTSYAKLSTLLQKQLNIPGYLNLLACMKYPEDKSNYLKYVEECCRDVNVKMLSYDYYIWDQYSEDTMRKYFWHIGTMRSMANKYKIPFWAYIQAGGQWNDNGDAVDSVEYYPNEQEFDFNVNTALASGAKGISYFPLIQPIQFAIAKNDQWDFGRNGLLGALGNKTTWYAYAQNIDKHIAVIDEVLMNSVNKGIIVNGKKAKEETSLADYVIKSGTFQELQSVSGEALVGCFNYNGKTALYAVNYDFEHAQKITLSFNKKHNIYMVQNAEKSYLNAKNLILDLAGGEGVLLVIE